MAERNIDARLTHVEHGVFDFSSGVTGRVSAAEAHIASLTEAPIKATHAIEDCQCARQEAKKNAIHDLQTKTAKHVYNSIAFPRALTTHSQGHRRTGQTSSRNKACS